MLKFVIDKNIPFAESMFAGQAEVITVDGHQISRSRLRDANALFVRSVTPVNEALLDGTPVRFVGTATIGYDHVDLEYLASRGIAFASAPGSNSNSVAEYIVAALLVLGSRYSLRLDDLSIGVVGVGNVGSKVVRNATALGMRVLQNDPPLARSTGGSQFLPLDALMEADIVTLHVPLTRSGADATFHLFDKKRIAMMKTGSILVNTSRGGVVDTIALKESIGPSKLRTAVLDVWEHEPSIDIELLNLTALGTPHIAGYSTDGKVNGAMMIYREACSFFDVPSTWTTSGRLPDTPPLTIEAPVVRSDVQRILHDAVLRCYPIERDDSQLREILSMKPEDRSRHFTSLRSNYPVRREFSATKVEVVHDAHGLATCLSELGFAVQRADVKRQ